MTYKAAMLDPLLSVYLNILRVGAALTVILFHLWPVLLPTSHVRLPSEEAVIAFFVISGFTIAYTADHSENSLLRYSVNRVTRLWSVTAPALAIGAAVTLAVAPVGLWSTPETWMGPRAWSFQSVIGASLANLFFLGQNWDLEIDPPFNAPFWSLNYEMWYYVIFGAWFYLRGPTRGWVTAALACAAGPKILLLMPCWLLGVWLYQARWALSERSAIALFVCTIAALIGLSVVHASDLIRLNMERLSPSLMGMLGHSRWFVGDYVVALFVAGNLAAARRLGHIGSWLLYLQRPATLAANYTLSLYLYHTPLMILLWRGIRLQQWSVCIPLFAGIVGLANLTERRRYGLRRKVFCLTDRLSKRLRLEQVEQPSNGTLACRPPAVRG